MTEGNIFSTDKKQLLLCLLPGHVKILTKDKLNCLISHKIRIGKGWTKKKPCHFALALLQ